MIIGCCWFSTLCLLNISRVRCLIALLNKLALKFEAYLIQMQIHWPLKTCPITLYYTQRTFISKSVCLYMVLYKSNDYVHACICIECQLHEEAIVNEEHLCMWATTTLTCTDMYI